MNEMFFLNPGLLGFVPAFVAGAACFVAINAWRKRAVQRRFGDPRLLAKTSQPLSTWRYVARALFAGAAAGFIMLAICQPVIPNGTQMIARGRVSAIAVVDVSRSMAAFDYPNGLVPPSAVPPPLMSENTIQSDRPSQIQNAGTDVVGTRLEMARHILLDYLIPTLDGNQLGVVSFAGKAFPQAYLTRDSKALRWVVNRGVTMTSAPGEGSSLGQALVLAMQMFDADAPPTDEKVLILFSDGGNDDPPELLAAVIKELKQRNIKVIVVGLGNVMPSKIPVSKLAQDDDYAKSLRDAGTKWYEVNGEVIKTGMDTALLQNLATAADGEFIHLHKASDLNLLKYVGKTSLQGTPGQKELFPYILGIGFLFLMLTFAVTHEYPTRRRP